MKFVALFMIISGLWIAFEIYRAPMVDNNGRITKPGKKLKDLWQKRR
jgi:hypothetical protein